MPSSYFNIALFAESEELIGICTDLARSNLAGQADGYLLGEDAWPHITLCQFSLNESQIPSVWSQIENLQTTPLKIRFSHIYILPGVMEHTGKRWVGLAVAPHPQLSTLQKTIYDKLLSQNIQSTTAPGIYFPHLTWARTDGKSPLSMTSFPAQNFWHENHSFSLSLGRTDENNFGIYRERLLPLPVRSRNAAKTTTSGKKT